MKNLASTLIDGYVRDGKSVGEFWSGDVNNIRIGDNSCIHTDDYLINDRINTIGYYQVVDNLDNISAEELIEKGNLLEVCSKNGLEIEEIVDLREVPKNWNLLPYKKWILLDERDHHGTYRMGKAVYIIKGSSELEEDVKIRIAIVQKPDSLRMYICPECLGTVWELEDFRELFYSLFNEYDPDHRPLSEEDVRRVNEMLEEVKVNSMVQDFKNQKLSTFLGTSDINSVDVGTLSAGNILYDSSTSSLNVWDGDKFLKFKA